MSDYKEQTLKTLEIFKTKRFLFPKNMPVRLKFAEYIDWFEKRAKKQFHQIPAMVHFNTDILDQFQDKIVWTGFSMADERSGMYFLHTLVQVDKNYHIVFMFSSEDKKPSVLATLYLQHIEDYIKFLEDNDKFMVKNSEDFVGFSPRNPMGISGFGGGVSQNSDKPVGK